MTCREAPFRNLHTNRDPQEVNSEVNVSVANANLLHRNMNTLQLLRVVFPGGQ